MGRVYNLPMTKRILDSLISNTADAAAEEIPGGDLRPFYITVQVSAVAGTALLEVRVLPGGEWVTHTAAMDCAVDEVKILSGSIAEVYHSARVTFTGTSGTNTIRIGLDRRGAY